METELSKTSEGQERLGRAKDRLDVRVAEIGQAEIDKGTKFDAGHEVDQGTAQEQKMENENDVADLFGNFDDDQEPSGEGAATEHFDMSPRSSFERTGGEDEMEDDSTDKRLRPRSPTVSYRTDEDSDIMDDGGLNGLDEIDRKILSAAILNVDITEVYSQERVARIDRKFGLDQRLGLQSRRPQASGLE